MDVLDAIFARARATCPRIVMSEGEDPRIVEAALRATRDGLAEMVLIGRPSAVAPLTGNAPKADQIAVLDPVSAACSTVYADRYFELRKHRGVDPETASKAIQDPLNFAAMMVRQGDAAGTIGGAVATTADTVRAALQIVGRAPGQDIVSSFFLMLLTAPFDRPVVFADCGLVAKPSAEELAGIAIASAQSYRAMVGEEPRVAMLSFSTLGSANHSSVDRVREALRIVREQAPNLVVDGELQFDAAIVPEIATGKAPGSEVAGQANVFIFPDLNSGNIGYKIAQRIGGAIALGPILQGLAAPANDLSRGCSAEDAYRMIAITAAQAAALEP
ncbi:MAG: phosphate acetyltransferase [Paracoccaceae bacterium]